MLGSPLFNVYVSDNDSIFDSPRKTSLKCQLKTQILKKNRYKIELQKQKKKAKRLKFLNINLKETINKLSGKRKLATQHEEEVVRCAEDANKDLLIFLSQKVPHGKISPTIRKFALTLNYYSPAAYKYVRGKFNSVLPHPRTLHKWYGNSGFQAGFTSQAFNILEKKSKEHRIIATLMVDEMAIRQQTNWSGRETIGLVDEGLGNRNEIATQAYVFMLVSNTENWKIPLGFFFINGLAAEHRANLIKICIQKCHNAGVDVIGLTFDGCASNIAAAEILGCQLHDSNNLKTTFPHPCGNRDVAVFLDASHMLKLVRNTFENKKIIFDKYNNKISWQFLNKLYKLQQSEGFKFANKVTKRHIYFRNQIMKVNLAAQLLSRSTAKSLELCAEMLTGWCQAHVKSTVNFITLFNNLFDTFNSRSRQKGFRKPISETNSKKIFDLFDEAEQYINSLTIYNKIRCTRRRKIRIVINKKKIVAAKCKTGFIGFLINIQSLKFLYNNLIKNEKCLTYISTYRLSQDHIELFFGKIRQHGGHNNNPNTRQFIGIYKKILCHLELSSNFRGNCLPLDNLLILGGSQTAAIENINSTCLGFKEREKHDSKNTHHSQFDTNCDILTESLDTDPKISDISKQVVGYIAGWVVRKLSQKIKCESCLDSLMSSEKLFFHKLITLKNMQGLIFPSQDMFDVCLKSEMFIKKHMLQEGCTYFTQNQWEGVKLSVLKSFIYSNTFETLCDHSREQAVISNHRVMLIKTIIDSYLTVRLHYLHKNTRITKRQKFNKLVLFDGN
jgi:DNA transposase THAP9